MAASSGALKGDGTCRAGRCAPRIWLLPSPRAALCARLVALQAFEDMQARQCTPDSIVLNIILVRNALQRRMRVGMLWHAGLLADGMLAMQVQPSV